ncbi:hypothetical protein [Streptomyces sp. NPDC127108]|uniref:hypothetical protein n=1 Tax=Streptomyces sp. NPDC127108 TaxID=3345361 RepID=UPI0036447F8B
MLRRSLAKRALLASTVTVALATGGGPTALAATPGSVEHAPVRAAGQAPMAPPGCTLRNIDGGRTAEARCITPGHYEHFVKCRTLTGYDLRIEYFVTDSDVFCERGVMTHDVRKVEGL